MSHWTKYTEKSPKEKLEELRSNYAYDIRHLEIAELKWSRLFLDARALAEELDADHQEYFNLIRKLGVTY